jgi:CheY-like chemotaxis protein
MTSSFGFPTPEEMLKSRIVDMLRQADSLIRAGKFTSGEEMLDRIFELKPGHDVATTYLNRLQLMVKQLSQRGSLPREVHEEIDRYKEYQQRKQSNIISKILHQAQELIREREFDKATGELRKVLALDSQNNSALALLGKIDGMRKAVEQEKNEEKFRTIVRDMWKDGSPSEYQRKVVQQVQDMLGITYGRRAQLELDVRNHLYKEALMAIFLTSGLEGFSSATIDTLREKYGIQAKDHAAIEAELLREVRKNKVKGIVFVVDSDEKFLMDVARMIRSKSFAVMTSSSTYDAAKTLTQVVPDIIISEVMFQGVQSGFDFYEFVRSNEKSKNTPFIFLSQSFDRLDMLIGKRLGVDEYFTKPLDEEILFATLDGKMLRKAGLEKEFAKKRIVMQA